MREVLLATGNPGKFKEIAEIFSGLPIRLLSLNDLKISGEGLFEDGETFQENAYRKASFFGNKAGILTLAEDSGILVNAFPGELGVKTRRWGAGEKSEDSEWVNYFLEKMAKEKNREAKFVCCACLFDPKKAVNNDLNSGALYFVGETSGVITEKLMAPILPGLPLSSCFLPDGYAEVYAALSTGEKNAVSHRGKAISKVRDFLFDFQTD